MVIRTAVAADVPLILQLIKDLAAFEQLSHEVVATEEGLHKTLFDRPSAEVVIADDVGFALFFTTYSTFLGKPGMYLEDLFVKPEARSRGIGTQMLKHLARICVQRDYGRFEWSVLDWNKDAIRFYERLGAKPVADWTRYRVSDDALSRLAR